MKSVFLAVFSMITLAITSNAFGWTADRCMADPWGTTCETALTVDAGNTSGKCGGAATSCDCYYVAQGYCYQWGTYSTNCPSGWTGHGLTATGKFCCSNMQQECWANPAEANQAQIELDSISAGDLQNVFNPNVNGMADAHWGIVNDTNRSPSGGRSVANQAKLDACIGHGNTDYLKTLSAFQQLSTCRGSSYCGNSLKNQYCTTTQANGETICQDRCDCVFGGTCNSY